VAQIEKPQETVWRTGSGIESGHEIYAMVFNDVTKPTRNDPLIGSMDTAELAEFVVEVHNRMLRKFGRHYKRALVTDD
jgi:hypothetical protein